MFNRANLCLWTWHTCYHRDWEPSVPVAWEVYQPPSHLCFLPDICPLSSAALCDAYGSNTEGWSTTHVAQVSEPRTPAKPLQEYFTSSTRWKVNFASVEKGGYSLFTMLPGPTGWVLRKLTYLNIITSSYWLPTVLSTHSLHTSRSRFQKVINATQHVPILFIQLNLFSNPVKCLVQKKGERLCFLNSNKMEQIQQFHADSDTKYVLLCQFRISNASAFFGRLTDLI